MTPAALDSTPSSGNNVAASALTTTNKTEGAVPIPFQNPKTDKPRPHVCDECKRAFARLEHLKRHERSHTKEKPFECPACQRCFARRDLLLRHQQKLHKEGSASTRPRNGRRESASAATATQPKGVRKNSIAGSLNGSATAGVAAMRPRANTMSHFDAGRLTERILAGGLEGFNDGLPAQRHMGGLHSHHASLSGFPIAESFEYSSHGVMGQPVGNGGGLPRLNTQLGANMGGGLRTAPPMQGFLNPFDFGKGFIDESTVDPQQLHFEGDMFPNSPFQQQLFNSARNTMHEEGNTDWGFNSDLLASGPGPTENAIDESSPSAMTTTPQSAFSDSNLDCLNDLPHTTTSMWPNPMTTTAPMINQAYSVDATSAVFAPELHPNHFPGQVGQNPNGPNDFFLTSTPVEATLSPTAGMHAFSNLHIQSPHGMPFLDQTNMLSSPSNGHNHRTSISSGSQHMITDATRQALIANVQDAYAPNLGYSYQRTNSQPTVSSPLSSSSATDAANQLPTIPSTADLQRYVDAYITFFHPHLPFLHIPTLSFNEVPTNGAVRSTSYAGERVVLGGGCLILAMAAIGALYEFERDTAQNLANCAKKLILSYLDQRRRKATAAAVMPHMQEMEQAPLWLIQAFLLNLVYGHNCGDMKAAQIATTHCASLVSLAKDAQLNESTGTASFENLFEGDIDMNASTGDYYEHSQWLRWKTHEEQKRTYYAVFVLSSLLVTAYAQAPRVLNSEIFLDLPCDEDLWTAENPQAWNALGGATAAKSQAKSFARTMHEMLEATGQEPRDGSQTPGHPLRSGMPDVSAQAFATPSTFGCYILINALHVYIWETRMRLSSRGSDTQETNEMLANVQPALIAWQTAWTSNPRHNAKRPNPFGPLSADCIPLLDCAYVRLFVDIDRTKESIWQRDFNAMAESLLADGEVKQSNRHMSQVDAHNNTHGLLNGMFAAGAQDLDAMGEPNPDYTDSNSHGGPPSQTKHERHLHSAALYAADSLLFALEQNVSFADYDSRELPLQSAMCTFECAQVLAEWAAAIQQRVGPYLGILGKDELDFSSGPATLLLEERDISLLNLLNDILQRADQKLAMNQHNSPQAANGPLLADLGQYSSGSKLLMIASHMLGRAGVWPVVTDVMAVALQSHAEHMQQRAEASARQYHQLHSTGMA